MTTTHSDITYACEWIATDAALHRVKGELVQARFEANRWRTRFVAMAAAAAFGFSFCTAQWVFAERNDNTPDTGSMPAGFLAGPSKPAELPAGFLGKDTPPAQNSTFIQQMLDTSWELNPLRVGPAYAECNCQGGPASPGSHPAPGNGGIFGAADRSVDQLIARYQTGTIGRAVGVFWRDLFRRGNLYNPSAPGNIPGLFLAGEPTGPGKIPARFLSSTACCNAPTGFVADQLSGGSWDGKGFGHWSW